MTRSTQVLYISHGGGPLPLLGDASHQAMIDSLKDLAKRIKRPKAILVVSAHWEAATLTLTSSEPPSLLYDYYGFPEEAYHIQYPCPGANDLAVQIQSALADAQIHVELDSRRGLDHGVFVPLKIMYPEADIPCLQLSLLKGLDAKQHIELGRALASLEIDDLLILGSGFSFHNMNAFFAQDTSEAKAKNEAFEAWLIDTCSNRLLDEADREQRLIEWEKAPHARYCHPREEHLLPLHVCYGVAERPCEEVIEVRILNKKASFYRF